MNSKTWVKILGLIAAFATGGASIVAGDLVTGLGILAASLSSVNIKN